MIHGNSRSKASMSVRGSSGVPTSKAVSLGAQSHPPSGCASLDSSCRRSPSGVGFSRPSHSYRCRQVRPPLCWCLGTLLGLVSRLGKFGGARVGISPASRPRFMIKKSIRNALDRVSLSMGQQAGLLRYGIVDHPFRSWPVGTRAVV